MQLANEKKAVIVPVLLLDCSWEQEDFAALENLPFKGKYVKDYLPYDKAWKLVEEGIRKAVEQARSIIREPLARR